MRIETQGNISFQEAEEKVNTENYSCNQDDAYQSDGQHIPNLTISSRAYPYLSKPRSQNQTRISNQTYAQRTKKSIETNNRYDCLDQIDIIPETQSENNSVYGTLPSLTTQPESSQKTQWFRPQKSRAYNKQYNNDQNYQSNSQDELLQILEGNTRSTSKNNNKKRSSPMIRTQTEPSETPQPTQTTDFMSQIKQIIQPLIPQLIKLMTANDLTSKIETIIDIAKIFNLQNTIEKALSDMQMSSRIDQSQC